MWYGIHRWPLKAFSPSISPKNCSDIGNNGLIRVVSQLLQHLVSEYIRVVSPPPASGVGIYCDII